LFVSPLYTHQTSKHSDDVDTLRVMKCKNLYLSLLPPGVRPSSGIERVPDSCLERNGMVMETPKKMPSTPLHGKESHYFASNSGSSMFLDPTTARAALADEKVNELLQMSATRWLNGRYLLKGNFVPLSMCGKLSLFVVMGAEFDLCEKGSTLPNAEDSSNLGGTLISILVGRTTKVHLSESVCTEKLDSDKPDHAPMLGGLSKESETIKGIISFSLADQIGLPRYCVERYTLPPNFSHKIHCFKFIIFSLFSDTKVFFFMVHLEQGKPLLLLPVPMMQAPTFLQ